MSTRLKLMILVFLGAFSQVLSQNTLPSRHGLYAESYLIRHDFSEGWFSVNYEYAAGKKANAMLRLGIYPDFQTTFSFPFTCTWITTPLSKHHFEWGFGGVYRLEFFESNVYKDFTAIMFPLMYRYQDGQGLYFRGGINLFVSWPVLPSPSLSIGYRF